MIEELSIPVSEESKIPMATTRSPMETSQGSESDTVVTTLGTEVLQATTLPSIDEGDDTITTLPPAPEEESDSDTVDTSEPMTTTESPMSSTQQPIPTTEQPEIPTTTVEEVEGIILTTPASVEELESEIEEGACLVNGTQYPDGNGFVVRLYQYPDGAIVPSDNACELCQCYSGDVICPVQECPPAPAGCTALPVPEGKCCPDYSCPVAQPDEDRDRR